MLALQVEILRFVDDTQPGWVECQLVDVSGETHVFVEKVPVVSCRHRGAAIDLVLDRPRLDRSQFVSTQSRGRSMIFWQTRSSIQNITLASNHPEILIDSIIVKNPTTSTSKNGSLQAIVTGGTGDLKYEWFKDGLSVGTNSIINDLSVGIYTLLSLTLPGVDYN